MRRTQDSNSLLPGLQVFKLTSASGCTQPLAIPALAVSIVVIRAPSAARIRPSSPSSSSSTGICNAATAQHASAQLPGAQPRQQQAMQVSKIPKSPSLNALTAECAAAAPNSSGQSSCCTAGLTANGLAAGFSSTHTAQPSTPLCSSSSGIHGGNGSGASSSSANTSSSTPPSPSSSCCSTDTQASRSHLLCSTSSSSSSSSSSSFADTGGSCRDVKPTLISCGQEMQQHRRQGLSQGSPLRRPPSPSILDSACSPKTAAAAAAARHPHQAAVRPGSPSTSTRASGSSSSSSSRGPVSGVQLLQHLQLPSKVVAMLLMPQTQSQQKYRERQRVELYAVNKIMTLSEAMRRAQQQPAATALIPAACSNTSSSMQSGVFVQHGKAGQAYQGV